MMLLMLIIVLLHWYSGPVSNGPAQSDSIRYVSRLNENEPSRDSGMI